MSKKVEEEEDDVCEIDLVWVSGAITHIAVPLSEWEKDPLGEALAKGKKTVLLQLWDEDYLTVVLGNLAAFSS